MATRRIYLDNAATSWPKPESVYEAVDHYQRQLGAAAGRGVYDQALQVDRRLQQARLAIAQWIDAPEPERVIFTYSGTDSLTLALRGLLRPGDHVVTTVCEHNSVLRPLRYLEDQQQLHVTRVSCDHDGVVQADDVLRACRRETRLIAMVHASNVTGAIQPVAEVARRSAGHGCRLLVDAAQSLGHLPVSVQKLGCHLLAAPGHKGLLGPTGTGLLYVAPGLERELYPLRLGGTGSRSESDLPPDQLPDRYEAGNLNVPGILGMWAGVEFLRQQGIEKIVEHERRLTQQLLEGLAPFHQITVYGPRDPLARVGVVSFNIRDHDPQEVATVLDQAAHVQVRAGFHCAPLMHRALHTIEVGGTIRVSVGPFTERQELETLLETVAQLLS